MHLTARLSVPGYSTSAIMSSRLQLLLVVLAAAYIATASCDECTYPEWGTRTGILHKLPKVELSSGIRDWKVPVPKQCTLNGVVAKVCDYDLKPEAYFIDHYHLYVHRTGKLVYPGSVELALYCA